MGQMEKSPPRVRGYTEHSVKIFIAASLGLFLAFLVTLHLDADILQTRGSVESFRDLIPSPALIVNLVKDSGTDCYRSTDSDAKVKSNHVSSSMPCDANPIIGDWPNIGHWAWCVEKKIPLLGHLSPLIASADVAWHLLFGPSATMTLIGVAQILIGFLLAGLISEQFDWAEHWLALWFTFGTLVLGALATWGTLYLADVMLAVVQIFVSGPYARAVAFVSSYGVTSTFLIILWEKAKDPVVDAVADTLAKKVVRRIWRN